jgi:hypothetical protein
MTTARGLHHRDHDEAEGVLVEHEVLRVAGRGGAENGNRRVVAGTAETVWNAPEVMIAGAIESVALPEPSAETSACTTNCCR